MTPYRAAVWCLMRQRKLRLQQARRAALMGLHSHRADCLECAGLLLQLAREAQHQHRIELMTQRARGTLKKVLAS